MKRRVVLALVVVLALATWAVAALQRPRNPDALFDLYNVEVIALLAAWIAALVYLGARRDRATGMLGVGLYALAVGLALVVLSLVWLFHATIDALLLFALLLGGEVILIGAGLVVASALLLAGAWRPIALGVGVLVGPGALVAVAAASSAGLLGYLTANVDLPVLLLLGAAVVVLVLLGFAILLGRQRRLVARPLALAGAGAAFTILLLVARGPADWASVSHQMKLYSFPLVVTGVAVSLAILDATAHGFTLPWRRRRADMRLARGM